MKNLQIKIRIKNFGAKKNDEYLEDKPIFEKLMKLVKKINTKLKKIANFRFVVNQFDIFFSRIHFNIFSYSDSLYLHFAY